MPILKNNSKKDRLEQLVKEIACPFDVLKTNGTECYCEYNNKIYKNRLGSVSLGSVHNDIKEHCKACVFKVKKPKVEFVNINLDENEEVLCPSSNRKVSPSTDCTECAFFMKAKIKEMYSKNPDAELTFIPCGFPNIPSENLQAWLEPKDKKEIKEKKKSDKTKEIKDIDF